MKKIVIGPSYLKVRLSNFQQIFKIISKIVEIAMRAICDAFERNERNREKIRICQNVNIYIVFTQLRKFGFYGTIKYNRMYIEWKIQCSLNLDRVQCHIQSYPIQSNIQWLTLSSIYCLLNQFILNIKTMNMKHREGQLIYMNHEETTLISKHA